MEGGKVTEQRDRVKTRGERRRGRKDASKNLSVRGGLNREHAARGRNVNKQHVKGRHKRFLLTFLNGLSNSYRCN